MSSEPGKLERIVKSKNLTAKKLIKASTIVLGIALIAVMTVANVQFDPGKINFFEWFTNSLVLVGIMVFGLLMGESIGADKQRDKPGGLYQTSLREYAAARAQIDAISIYFYQFYMWYKEKELKAKKRNILIDAQFDGRWAKEIVEHVAPADMEPGKMIMGEGDQEKIYCKPDGKGGTIKIKKVTPEQAETVARMFKAKIDCPDYSYFLTAFGGNDGNGNLERGKTLNRRERSDKALNRAIKIISSLFISFVWGMATTSDFADGDAQKKAWFNLISRVMALMTSFASGWSGAALSVKTKAEIIGNKTDVLGDFRKYSDNGEFVPETYDQMVERELREQENAKAAVVESAEEG